MRLNRVSFWEMGMSWPWHMAQPAGAKLPPNMRISPIYGLPMCALSSLVPRREDALEGDDEVEHEEGLPVFVGLTAADVGDRGGGERRGVRDAVAITERRDAGEEVAGRGAGGRVIGLHIGHVSVRRHLRLRQCVKLLSATLALAEALTDVDRNAPTKVGEREVDPPVATVGCTQ